MKDNDFEELWNSGATARKYRQCHISDQELETIIGNAIERDNKTRKKHFPIWQKPYVYLAMVVACVAAVVVGLWQLRINSVLIPNTSEALQPSPTILVAQTIDKPATITDNEIKNKPTTEQNTMPTTATPQPDIIAITPIEQEHIPVLLAETETQIEQNYFTIDTTIDNINALHTDTILQLQKDLPKYETNYLAYIDDTNNTNLIPDISNTNTNEDLCSLNMITYCNIRCSSNNVTEKIINKPFLVNVIYGFIKSPQ